MATVEVHRLTYWGSNDEFLLKGVSCVARPGELLGILGGSGTGKSVLLNSISGESEPTRRGQRGGAIKINGITVHKALIALPEVASVHQSDVPNAVLTVMEAMTYAAELRLHFLSPGDRRQFITRIARLIDIWRLRDKRISQLSGGEKKRVGIAVFGLLSPARILLLDEPTTGLSSAGALALMRHLKRMAQVLNITVIMTIHQPSRRAYECLDSVVLLAQGGVCAYAGLRRDTPDWLAAHHLHLPNEMSPAEGIVAAVTQRFSAALMHASQTRLDEQTMQGMQASIQADAFERARRVHEDIKAAKFHRQVLAIVARLFHSCRKNFALFWLPIGITLFMSLITCVAFAGVKARDVKDVSGRRNVLFLSIHVAAYYQGPLMLMYMSERARTSREIINGWYTVAANTVAWVIAMVVIAVITSGLQTSVLHAILGMGVPFLEMWLMLFLQAATILSMVLAVAALPIPRADTIVIAVIASCMILGVCSGVIVNHVNLPDLLRSWMPQSGFFYHAMGFLVVRELHYWRDQDDTPLRGQLAITAELSEFVDEPITNFLVVCSWLASFVVLFYVFTKTLVARSVVKPKLGADMVLYLWQQEQDEYITNVKQLLHYAGPDISKIMSSSQSSSIAKIRSAMLQNVSHSNIMESLKQLKSLSSDGVQTVHLSESGFSAGGIGPAPSRGLDALLPSPQDVCPPRALEALRTVLRRYLMVRRSAVRMKRQRAQFEQAAQQMGAPFGAHNAAGIAPWLREFEVTFHDLTFRAGDQTIINGVTGRAYPGRLTAILGPSGAGKTTLLNMIAGNADLARSQGVQSGRVAVNGVNLTQPLLRFRVASYVKQMDELPGRITVAETVEDAILLNTPPGSTTAATRWKLMKSMLQGLGLLHMASSSVRKLSGGQLKRLVIACGALLKGARIIILDEPTSGLSSKDAIDLVLYLQTIAHVTQATVLLTIHQPPASAYAALDDVLILKQGNLVYHGEARRVPTYFRDMGLRLDVRDSIADSALERITSKSVPRVEPTIEDMSIGSLSEEMFEVGYGTTIGVELRVLCRRAFRMQWREPTSSVVLVAGYLFVCLFGGVFASGVPADQTYVFDMWGIIGFLVVTLGGCIMCGGLMHGVTFDLITEDVARLRYRLWTVLLAEMGVSSLRVVVLGLLGSCIMYPLLAVEAGVENFLLLAGTLMVTALFCDAGFQAISYLLLGKMSMGAIISVCFTALNLSSVLSGVARLPSFVRWVPKVNPVSYMTLNYMRALVYDGDFTVSETHRLWTNYTGPFISGADIMALRNLDADRSSYVLGVGASFAALLAWQLMFRGVAWCAIRRRAHQLQVMPTPGKVPLAELPTGVLPASHARFVKASALWPNSSGRLSGRTTSVNDVGRGGQPGVPSLHAVNADPSSSRWQRPMSSDLPTMLEGAMEEGSPSSAGCRDAKASQPSEGGNVGSRPQHTSKAALAGVQGRRGVVSASAISLHQLSGSTTNASSPAVAADKPLDRQWDPSRGQYGSSLGASMPASLTAAVHAAAGADAHRTGGGLVIGAGATPRAASKLTPSSLAKPPTGIGAKYRMPSPARAGGAPSPAASAVSSADSSFDIGPSISQQTPAHSSNGEGIETVTLVRKVPAQGPGRHIRTPDSAWIASRGAGSGVDATASVGTEYSAVQPHLQREWVGSSK